MFDCRPSLPNLVTVAVAPVVVVVQGTNRAELVAGGIVPRWLAPRPAGVRSGSPCAGCSCCDFDGLCVADYIVGRHAGPPGAIPGDILHMRLRLSGPPCL